MACKAIESHHSIANRSTYEQRLALLVSDYKIDIIKPTKLSKSSQSSKPNDFVINFRLPNRKNTAAAAIMGVTMLKIKNRYPLSDRSLTEYIFGKTQQF